MTDHDPLCPGDEWTAPGHDPCACDLIRKTRADEREHIAQEIEAYDEQVCEPLGERCTCHIAASIARGEQP